MRGLPRAELMLAGSLAVEVADGSRTLDSVATDAAFSFQYGVDVNPGWTMTRRGFVPSDREALVLLVGEYLAGRQAPEGTLLQEWRYFLGLPVS